jgi:hypothetical protein
MWGTSAGGLIKRSPAEKATAHGSGGRRPAWASSTASSDRWVAAYTAQPPTGTGRRLPLLRSRARRTSALVRA